MPKIVTCRTYPFKPVLSLFLLVILAGCASQGATVLEEKSSQIQSLVVVGFIPVLSAGEEPGVVQGPFGATYMAIPVDQEVSEKMTESLFAKLTEENRYDLVTPGQAKGALESLLASSPALDGVRLYQEVGKDLSAEGIVVGFLYRWIERQGADFAISRPASVGFDLYLLRSADGEIVWRGKFDKTQQSFFENVLDFETFLKSKGRWVKAETLSEMGLKELLEKFPKGPLERETKE